jgi:hypothetical protein
MKMTFLFRPYKGDKADPMHISDEELRRRLETLRQEHRDLDRAIEALGQSDIVDQLQLARLKKRKLLLRDMIVRFENELIPDIIA